MTLKTFHFAGVASMNVTLGVPRIKEIINATDKISTPIITASLVNKDSVVSARIVKGRIEKTELGDIAEYIKEVYSPNGCYLTVKLDMKAINALKLEVDIESVRTAIIKTSKLKVKEKHIVVVSPEKLQIEPFETSRDKMYFSL
jgi:DNA-directed RNA polymerase III subunit RPC1